MTTPDTVDTPFDPIQQDTIELAISNVTLAPEGGAAIDFRIAASAPNTSGGYQLWSEDSEGALFRHSSTKNHGEMHAAPFGTRLWWADVRPYTANTMRFFAARGRENPVRASAYVEVVVPAQSAPTEFSARDGGLKVLGTGRVRPNGRVRFGVAGKSITVQAQAEGQWRAVIDVPAGSYTASAVSLGGLLPDSASVSVSVLVGEAPDIPLLLLFPEVDRKITRLTRVTGTARPRSQVQVSLGDGPVATAEAGPGGAWEVLEARSDRSGKVNLFVENPETGEALQRSVEVDYFPHWEVSHLIAGPICDEGGVITRSGAIAEGSGSHNDIIQYSTDGRDPWQDLASVGADGRWRFEQLIVPPPPPFRLGRLFLRALGDPLQREYYVEPQAPVITLPQEGIATGASPEFSGVSALPFVIELQDGTTIRITPDRDHAWRVVLGPFEPGAHTVIARSSARSQREVTRRTFLVLEPHGTEADQ